MKPLLLLALPLAAALPGTARAGDLRTPTNRWVAVEDTATLCTHPGGQGQCVRFRAPDAETDGPTTRLFRVVGDAPGGQLEIQARFVAEVAECGVLPARLTPFKPRLYVAADRADAVSLDDPCVLPGASDMPGPGRDLRRLDQRVAVVAAGAVAYWPDGALAGGVARDLWLMTEHGPWQDGARVCASFALGPDDGGPVQDRVLDACFDASQVRFTSADDR